MDVARLNFSHGAHEHHATAYRRVREASDATGRAVAVLADLQGPKIRLGTFADGPGRAGPTGSQVCITTEDVVGHRRARLHHLQEPRRRRPRRRPPAGRRRQARAAPCVRGRGPGRHLPGRRGRRGLEQQGPVPARRRRQRPGAVGQGRGRPRASPCDLGVDFIALSFVRSPEDVELVRDIMRAGGHHASRSSPSSRSPRRSSELEAIVEAFDGIMVARGDLGVELPLEQVPLVQKRAIQAARERDKPVIVATQMLESMITNSRPTRAEASDVANAVLDGADAVMLSGETVGRRAPDRRRADDGTHHRRRRERPHVGARGAAPLPLALGRDRAGGQGRRRGARRQGAGHLHPDRRDGPPARRAAPASAAAGLHRRRPRPQPAGPVLGRGDVPGALGRSTPTTWWPRWTSRCCPSAGSRSATGSSSSPAARPTPWARPT